MKTLVVCGDSFAYGIGCLDLHNQPFGVQVAKELGWNLIQLARGSASNYTIFLQGMYAADLEDKPHLIILNKTSYDRVEWIKDNVSENIENQKHTLRNLNYHQYPPHFHPQPGHETPMDFCLKNNPLYDPYILSEQIAGIIHSLEFRKKKEEFDYYTRLDTEPIEKLQMIVDYNLSIANYEIKRNYDIGMLLQAYTYIKKKGINCLVMTNEVEEYSKFFDKEDIFQQDWGKLSRQYPDKIGSMHTSEEGHDITARRLIRKIKDINLA